MSEKIINRILSIAVNKKEFGADCGNISSGIKERNQLARISHISINYDKKEDESYIRYTYRNTNFMAVISWNDNKLTLNEINTSTFTNKGDTKVQIIETLNPVELTKLNINNIFFALYRLDKASSGGVLR